MNLKLRRIAATVVCVVVVASEAAAQSTPGNTTAPPRTTSLTIRTFGGLLGQVEGFCEDPGGVYDWSPPLHKTTASGAELTECAPAKGLRGPKWLGGILGARSALARSAPQTGKQGGEQLLIVAPNNFPNDQLPIWTTGGLETRRKSPFWELMAGLKPDIVALGPEDFFRSVRRSPAPTVAAPLASPSRDLKAWATSRADIPLLVSNVSIREYSKRINGVEFTSDGYDFHLDLDVTVSWTGSIKVEHPREAELGARLQEFAAGSRRPGKTDAGMSSKVEIKPGKGGADGIATFPHGLRPDRWHRLIITEDGSPKASLVFRTDAVLTPRPANRPELSGFPAWTRAESSVLGVVLIDPETKKGAGAAAWKWKEGTVEREVLFDDPEKTLKVLSARATVETQGIAATPLTVLVSSLNDDQTTTVLTEFPNVRFVVLSQESRLLARASKKEERPEHDTPEKRKVRFSGDLGFSSVIDAHTTQSTKVMVRPEWFGETLVTIQATSLARVNDGWEVLQPKVSVETVAGAEFKTSVLDGVVTYAAGQKNQPDLVIERLHNYEKCADQSVGHCAIFRRLWTDGSELAALLGDALRYQTGADLALFSRDIIDSDYLAYVKRRLEEQKDDTGWISRYILERLVYQSPRIVKAFVPGADLAGTLKKVLAADDQNCLSGVAGGCPTSIAADHPERLRINGRSVNPRLVYTIAMPDFLAEQLELDHDDETDLVDAVAAADDHLVDGRWRLSTAAGPVSARFEDRANRKWEGYIAVPTLDVGLTEAEPRDPEGAAGVRKNLGLGFSGAKKVSTRSIAVETDTAFIDRPRFAIRAPVSVKYSRRTQDGDTTYEDDEFSAGIRFDWKFRWVRPFAGLFVDGQLFDHHSDNLKASRDLATPRDGFKSSETAAFSTAYVVRPRRFTHRALGADVLENVDLPLGRGFGLAVKRVGARMSWGTESRVPTAIRIGGEDRDDDGTYLDRFLSGGDQALINHFFNTHPESFTADTEFAIDTSSLDQMRLQADGELTVKYKPKKKEYSAEMKSRWRWYDTSGPAFSPFLLTSETKFELKLVVPLWWKFNLVPSYEYQRASIERSDADIFSYHKGELKLSLPLMVRFGRSTFIR